MDSNLLQCHDLNLMKDYKVMELLNLADYMDDYRRNQYNQMEAAAVVAVAVELIVVSSVISAADVIAVPFYNYDLMTDDDDD